MKNESKKRHTLYEIAFGALREKAREIGVSLKKIAIDTNYSGKVLRRGTPGAFGFVPKPPKSAKTNRKGFNAPGNSRDRRFARRHPQHFNAVEA